MALYSYLTSGLASSAYHPATPAFKVSYRSGGSTTLTVRLDALRPQNTHDTASDEFALVVNAPDITELRSTWRSPHKGHQRVYEGNSRFLSYNWETLAKRSVPPFLP
ncbi:hypothetical protein ABZ816_28695 [Actinosynnema sp. NPDC047251]|uniref:Uncharacterized protein n=1 Tax=Saccharothrix espanaensis (strain ATCC 51144 / DSM 44229 / JCM 9112 / NBRC 15066 / NRRL 15764) TaxID=1179773 RepID=K0JRE4_SACES|nr:hypothetical protein [Saccharothrix espanaensis]CCH28366.1 hypothetical protein BN6_10380 [Saccharothrix espanaensis DSM 44229]